MTKISCLLAGQKDLLHSKRETQRRLEETERRLEQTTKLHSLLQDDYKAQSSLLANKERSLSETDTALCDLQSRYHDLQLQHNGCMEQLADKSAALEQAGRRLDFCNTAHPPLVETIRNQQQRIRDLECLNSSVGEMAKEYQEQINVLRSELTAVQQKLNTVREDAAMQQQSLRSQVKSAQQEVLRRERAFEEFVSNRVATLKSEHEATKVRAKMEEDGLCARVQQVEEELTRVQSELRTLESAHDNLARSRAHFEQKANQLQFEFDQSRQQVQALQGELDSAAARENYCQQQHSQCTATFHEMRSEVERWKEHAQSYQEQLDQEEKSHEQEINNTRKIIRELKREIEAYKIDQRILRDQGQELETERDHLRARNTHLEGTVFHQTHKIMGLEAHVKAMLQTQQSLHFATDRADSVIDSSHHDTIVVKREGGEE